MGHFVDGWLFKNGPLNFAAASQTRQALSGVLRLVFTSDGIGVSIVIRVVIVLTTQ